MRVLGIETATSICSVAVAQAQEVLAERWTGEQHVHSEKFIRLLMDVLAEVHLNLDDVDGIAVSVGPGSFTGLRIGLSAAKGLCHASGKPLIAVPTLDALVHRTIGVCHEGSVVCAVIDAKRDEVYSAWYEKRGQSMEKRSDYRVLLRDEFVKTLGSRSSVLVTGEDAERSLERLRVLRGGDGHLKGISVAPRELRRASAEPVALLGVSMLTKGSTSDLAGIEPMYLKEFLITR